jgi:hypothetical protein
VVILVWRGGSGHAEWERCGVRDLGGFVRCRVGGKRKRMGGAIAGEWGQRELVREPLTPELEGRKPRGRPGGPSLELRNGGRGWDSGRDGIVGPLVAKGGPERIGTLKDRQDRSGGLNVAQWGDEDPQRRRDGLQRVCGRRWQGSTGGDGGVVVRRVSVEEGIRETAGRWRRRCGEAGVEGLVVVAEALGGELEGKVEGGPGKVIRVQV